MKQKCIYLILLLQLTACASVSKVPAFSMDPSVSKKYREAQNPKIATFKKCAQLVLFVPISLPPTEEDIQTAMYKDAPGANALVDVETKLWMLATGFYSRICTEVSGYPVKI